MLNAAVSEYKCIDQGKQYARTSLKLQDSGFDESLCVSKDDTFTNSRSSWSCIAINVHPMMMTLVSKESQWSRSFPGAIVSQSQIPIV